MDNLGKITDVKGHVKALGLTFGPCINVGNCDRKVCPFQHVEDTCTQKNSNDEKEEKSSEVKSEQIKGEAGEVAVKLDIDSTTNGDHESGGNYPEDGVAACKKSGNYTADEVECDEQLQKNSSQCISCKARYSVEESVLKCHNCSRIVCGDCHEIPSDNQMFNALNSKAIKGLTWLCGDCYETIGEENTNVLSLVDKVEEQNIIIQRTIQTNEEQREGWEAQKDSLIQKINSLTTEVQVLEDKLRQEQAGRSELEKINQGHKQEKANYNKIINKLQEDTRKYKELYENAIAECEDNKRSLRNMNALVERFLIIPDDTKESEKHTSVGPEQQKQRPEPMLLDETVISGPSLPKSGDTTSKMMHTKKTQEETQSGDSQQQHQVNLEEEERSNKLEDTSWGRIMDADGDDTEKDVYEGREQNKCRVYVGNIPENTKEADIMKFFGSYLSSLEDIELTRQVMKNGKEKSVFAIILVNEDDLEEVLAFDGTTVSGRQIVVERTKSCARTPHPEENTDEEATAKITCKFYLQGRCNKPKGQCRFNHPKPCSFYSKNKRCRFGENCKFAHVANRNSINKGQGDGSVALLTTFLQALGLPQLSLQNSSQHG